MHIFFESDFRMKLKSYIIKNHRKQKHFKGWKGYNNITQQRMQLSILQQLQGDQLNLQRWCCAR